MEALKKNLDLEEHQWKDFWIKTSSEEVSYVYGGGKLYRGGIENAKALRQEHNWVDSRRIRRAWVAEMGCMKGKY